MLDFIKNSHGIDIEKSITNQFINTTLTKKEARKLPVSVPVNKNNVNKPTIEPESMNNALVKPPLQLKVEPANPKKNIEVVPHLEDFSFQNITGNSLLKNIGNSEIGIKLNESSTVKFKKDTINIYHTY